MFNQIRRTANFPDQNPASKVGSFSKKFWLSFEGFTAIAAAFTLVTVLNWFVVTIDLLQPEDLEMVMKWRACVSRLLWLVCMVTWAQIRLQGLISAAYARAVALIFYFVSLSNAWSQHFQQVCPSTSSKLETLSEQPFHYNGCQQIKDNIFKDYSITLPSRKRRRACHDQFLFEEVHAASCQACVCEDVVQDLCLGQDSDENLAIDDQEIAFGTEKPTQALVACISQSSKLKHQRFVKCRASRNTQLEASTQTEPSYNNDTHSFSPETEQTVAKARIDDAEALRRKMEEEAARTKQAKAEAFIQFFSRRTILMARATRPQHPKAIVKCEIDTPTKAMFRSRALPTGNEDADLGWTEQQFDWVFGIAATNEEVFGKIEPVITELQNPTGRSLCLGADGFSGCGKSYTMENLLAMVGKELLSESNSNLGVVFEAFQSSGTDKITEAPRLTASTHMFRKERPCYVVTSFNAFRSLIQYTANFRTKSGTNNNATSSRTHLVIMLYVTLGRNTSTLCIFDLAGNERKDALEGVPETLKEKEEQTSVINNSRLNIYAALEAAVEGKRQVTRETAVGTLLMALLINRKAMLIMIFHMSIYTSFNGAVAKTLKDVSALKRARAKRQKLEATASTGAPL